MSVNWSSEITVDGKKTTLHQFLQSQYLYKSDRQISEVLDRCGFQVSVNAVKKKRRREGWRKPSGVGRPALDQDQPEVKIARELESDALLQAIKNRPRSLRELSLAFDRSEQTIRAVLDSLHDQHYNIVEVDGKPTLSTAGVDKVAPPPQTLADEQGMVVRFGVASDLHAGSTAQQITNLKRFVVAAYDQGIRHILVPGDWFAGTNVYRGQIHDLYAIGADNQIVALDLALPYLPGLAYLGIGGNHDYSFVKAAGFNVVAAFADRRDDVTYLGYDMADVPITDRVDARLWHPSGGVPYAVSYRLQKGLEQIAYDELASAVESGENPKMRVVLSGHLHISMTMNRGPIFGLQAGCFEGQTNYLKRKALFPEIGGYLLTIWLTDGGLIQRVRHEWMPFTEIPEDYTHYPEIMDALHRQEEREIEPMFQWQPGEENGPAKQT